VNGAANGTADITTLGLNLNNANADITIGKVGNVTGFAVSGATTNGLTLSDQVDLTASTTGGNASASGSFDTFGILGAGTDTDIIAGPNGGNIIGTALGGGRVLASTIDGNATTGISDGITFGGGTTTTDIVGIQNVDLFGGMVGTNTIAGRGFGSFDSAATTVNGTADATSNVNVNGILGTGANTINTAGNVSAQAILSNTVVASSVSGAATATANSNAVGLSGMSVTIIGNGRLEAGARSSSLSTASSNAGNAIA
jgi:hypothetical protein